MGRRLLQRLQQGVEGGDGEHVDFVDDVDLVAPLAGGEVDLLAQQANVVDAGVAGGVDLDQVEEAGLVDGVAERAGVCLLYTSEAADERPSVDLGGRRIITKKKKKKKKIKT